LTRSKYALTTRFLSHTPHTTLLPLPNRLASLPEIQISHPRPLRKKHQALLHLQQLRHVYHHTRPRCPALCHDHDEIQSKGHPVEAGRSRQEAFFQVGEYRAFTCDFLASDHLKLTPGISFGSPSSLSSSTSPTSSSSAACAEQDSHRRAVIRLRDGKARTLIRRQLGSRNSRQTKKRPRPVQVPEALWGPRFRVHPQTFLPNRCWQQRHRPHQPRIRAQTLRRIRSGLMVMVSGDHWLVMQLQ